MARQKQTVVSFRVDGHLAEILEDLPDKSTFIRDAVLRRVHGVCPSCQGRGVLPCLIADWLQANLQKVESVECTCCHYQYPTELVQDQLPKRARDDFLCPHCADPKHQH